MKAVITGQVGLDKTPYLEEVVAFARRAGETVRLANVGQRMYAEAPDVAAGRILDLPLSRLRDLRRAAFREVLGEIRPGGHLIVNTHATFRWRHGLFAAFDHDHMMALDADLYICLVDSVDAIHARLRRDGHSDHSLKDLMVWREEEMMATELLSQIVRGHGRFYVQARGRDGDTAEMLYRLLFRPNLKKAYLSFPMSHIGDQPLLAAEIQAFRNEMKRCFVCFDPGDLEEKPLCQMALEAVEQGRRMVSLTAAEKRLEIDAQELVSIIGDIDGQIYARDFKLIDQSDMIISFIPELAGGGAALSSGVERELQHAHEAAKDVFVIWRSRVRPSPFITETATRVFSGVAEAVDYFHDSGLLGHEGGGLFAQNEP
jgi:adenylate kinase